MKKASIPLAAVIGYPVAHSRSPALHGHWLQRYGIRGYYLPLEVAPDRLESVLKAMPHMGFVGANVTIPHKEEVLKLADSITDQAKAIGAANTLTFGTSGEIIADNTDGYGFLENLRQHSLDWTPLGEVVAIIGAGGASRAVVASCIENGAKEIRLTNRTIARSNAIQKEFGPKIRVVEWAKAADALDGATTIVNASSIGMTGDNPFPVSLDHVSPSALVTDLVYTPLDTPFLKAARQRGCQTIDGLGMLIHQGVPGFERWFGVRPQVDDAVRSAVLGV